MKFTLFHIERSMQAITMLYVELFICARLLTKLISISGSAISNSNESFKIKIVKLENYFKIFHSNFQNTFKLI